MDYVIILNGEKPKVDRKIFENRKVICADGAYGYAKNNGIEVDLVIGDFDSYDINSISQKIMVRKFSSDKDQTDGELALNHAIDNGAKDIIIIGAAGGREDHFFANIILLYIALKRGVSAKILTDNSYIIMFDKDISINVDKGYYLSIVPFVHPLHIINTEGLKYNISDKVLSLDGTLGISNITLQENVQIFVKSGCGIVFATKEKADYKNYNSAE